MSLNLNKKSQSFLRSRG